MLNDISLHGESYRATIDDLRPPAARDPSWSSGSRYGVSRDALIARCAATAAVIVVLLVLGIGFGLAGPSTSHSQDGTARNQVTGVAG